MEGGVRLRQVALVAFELGPVADQIQTTFGLGDPFRDPIVGEFGLENAVFAVGDTFIEVVAPIRSGTAAGRHLERHGGDTGYMAIFQVPDLDDTRRRIDDLGIRVVWKVEFPDLVGMHLHPRDVPGAIVSLDWANPPGSWRWGGQDWTAREPAPWAGGLTGVTLEVKDPQGIGERWAHVLGSSLSVDRSGTMIRLEPAGHPGQVVSFVPASGTGADGIREVSLCVPVGAGAPAEVVIGGVRFVVEAEPSDGAA